jgi:hypothetical protein
MAAGIWIAIIPAELSQLERTGFSVLRQARRRTSERSRYCQKAGGRLRACGVPSGGGDEGVALRPQPCERVADEGRPQDRRHEDYFPATPIWHNRTGRTRRAGVWPERPPPLRPPRPRGDRGGQPQPAYGRGSRSHRHPDEEHRRWAGRGPGNPARAARQAGLQQSATTLAWAHRCRTRWGVSPKK